MLVKNKLKDKELKGYFTLPVKWENFLKRDIQKKIGYGE
jgi:hypothetical protein